MKPTRVPGRFLAWVSIVVALGVSVAANVAFARPAAGPRLSASTAPILALLAAALLERAPLATARVWQKWLAWIGLGTVGLAAFTTSYQHQFDLLIAYGNPRLSAVLLPIAVDGLIVLASVCLAVIAERRRALAANDDSTDTAGDKLVKVPDPDAGPGGYRYESAPVTYTMTDTDSRTEQPKPQVRRTPRKASTGDRVAAAKRRTPDASAAEIARRLKVTERTVARHLAAMTPVPVFTDAVSDTHPHNGSTVQVPA